MNAFLVGAAGLILAVVGIGLIRLLRGPTRADRTMAVQLIGAGGVAVLLLQGVASNVPALFDVALTLALLAAFMPVALAKGAAGPGSADAEADRDR